MSARVSQTPLLGLNKPDPGGDNDVWGNELNHNFDILDNALLAPTAASLYLPIAGGALSGPLGIAQPSYRRVALPGIVAGVLTLDFSLASVFRVTLTQNIANAVLSNARPGVVSACELELLGDGTARTVAFGGWTMATGTPVPTSAVGRKDIYDVRSDGAHVVVWLTAQNVPA